MLLANRVLPGERDRLLALGAVLFANAVVVESNEVVATSGFVSNVGAPGILAVWAADMLIVIVGSAAYSLFVDRTRRERLAVWLFAGFSLVYLLLFVGFVAGLPDIIAYPLLTVITDQQWILFPLLIWALANDLFATAAAKRIFPLLGAAAILGAVVGSGLAAIVGPFLADGPARGAELLLLNSVLLLASGVGIFVYLRRLAVVTRQTRDDESMLDALREGLAFIREVPAFRSLSLAMVLLGFGLNVLEFQFIVSAASAFPDAGGLQWFYGVFRAGTVITLLLVGSLVAPWLMNHIGFKWIFFFMPGMLIAGLLLVLTSPVLIAAALGDYLARVTLGGVEDPARRAFQGMVPDERRGRVSAFMDGYLYPAGSIISCIVVGCVLLLSAGGILVAEIGRALYLSLAVACAATALVLIFNFRKSYDTSMLNWRLRRRRRGSALAGIDL